MALTSRLTLTGPDTSDPEDFLSSSLGIIFPDDITNQHGDADHGLLYTSPHLPNPLQFNLAKVSAEKDRHLFSHYLWNSSLLLAELIEASTLNLNPPSEKSSFDVTGLATIELGAGTALPSVMGGLLGAEKVVVTDYPTTPVIKTLRENVNSLIQEKNSVSGRYGIKEIKVDGHAWGEFDTELAKEFGKKFDRVYVADCLWMPWQHENLRRSIEWFMKEGDESRAWVVAGFHTGREKMAPFFDEERLRDVGLEVERIWERDCDGIDREWVVDRGVEDISVRKRWLVVGVLRRVRKEGR
ncbi:hypothetical protein QBC38DRAFT_478565 [Podospora fimiseda]|uniref:Nicotinamide N-methyltransferase n=1 Tax=Podospora fimiseda TaxID=252190 RepID=A0AAN7H224_9PEZI|nr:hypothetical protein QBC38DRAFT_478565 [Podospora fimiseda]